MAHKNVTCEICSKEVSTRGLGRHMEAHSRKGEILNRAVEAAVEAVEEKPETIPAPVFKTDETDCPACKGHGITYINGGVQTQCEPCLGSGNKNLDHDYNITTNTNETETDMAAKKKASSKTSAKVKTPKAPKEKAEKPIGRGRKLLLRLSHEEYAQLQAKAKKLETTMADLLRTGALG